MQQLFDEVASLDKRCYDEFFLSEDILMEHAAQGMASYIRKKFPKNSKVVIVCGGGNNGADGIALARILHKDYCVGIFYAQKPKSQMALLQQKRAISIGVMELQEVQECIVLVDAIFGSGFSGELSQELQDIISQMNQIDAFKIACDIPTALLFRADTTLTMGALKKQLFLDKAKDVVGEIEVIDLGVSRDVYEKESKYKLLDFSDMCLPFRQKKNSNKGNFGHLALALGQKSGASIMSALSALRFGSGLVSLVGYENITLPHSLMYSHEVPANATALAIGMGLGDEFSTLELNKFLDNSLPIVVDADMFYKKEILNILKRDEVVLTPHPKEFSSLLKITSIADVSVEELQERRFYFVEEFCKKYPKATLLLKGANVIIARADSLYINPHGSVALAKGGSGDVLSGLIGALLAQGYSTLDAAVNGSLAHTKLSCDYRGANFSLTPDDLIEGIKNLRGLN